MPTFLVERREAVSGRKRALISSEGLRFFRRNRRPVRVSSSFTESMGRQSLVGKPCLVGGTNRYNKAVSFCVSWLGSWGRPSYNSHV